LGNTDLPKVVSSYNVFSIVISEDFATLTVLSLGARVLSRNVQKVRFCPMEKGDPNKLELRANDLFDQIKQQGDL
jgi:hypothetical protein